MKFLYRKILKESLLIVWRLKYLWFFGIFASIFFNGEEYSIIGDNFKSITNLEMNIRSFHENIDWGFISETWDNIKDFLAGNMTTAILTIVALILITAAIIYLIIISQTAIINAASRFRRQEKSVFFEGFIVGTKYFWPVFIINLLAKAILYGLFLLFGLPLALLYLKFGNFAWLGFFSLMSFLILIPLNIFIVFIMRYASIYVVLKGDKIKLAVKKSLGLFRKNWLVTFENAIILFSINLIVSFFIIGMLAFAELPFSQIGYIFYTIIVIFVGALLTVFQTSAWTILFSYLEEGQGVPKLIRLFRGKSEEQK